MVISNKIISIIREEVERMNNIFSAEHVANRIYSFLEPEQEDADLTYEDYYEKIKMFGDKFELIMVDSNILKGFSKDWDSNSVETYEYMFKKNMDIPEIVITENYQIIDGSNRATAAMLQKKKIMAFKAISNEKINTNTST